MCAFGDSPHFIHQAVHLTHQPLVLLLKLDRNTESLNSASIKLKSMSHLNAV